MIESVCPALRLVNREEATMSVQATTTDRGGKLVHANGIDIHYLDIGEGEPVVLLHGGVVSTSSL